MASEDALIILRLVLPDLADKITGPQAAGGASLRGPSRLISALSCERKYAFRYVNQIVPKSGSEVALTGTLVHLGLAYWYAEQMPVNTRPEWSYEPFEEALERTGEGYPGEIAQAREILEYLKYVMNGEAFRPLYVEHEFRATVGELDPDGEDEAEIHYESPERDMAGNPIRSYHAPRLNDEIVTCRSDVVGEEAGLIYIRDHKTKDTPWYTPGGRDRLPVWKSDNEYSLNWQALVNLHIVRHTLGADAVAGFQIHRIKRSQPFDRDVHTLTIPARAYDKTPRSIRAAVKREREIGLRLAMGGEPVEHFWACYAPYKCDYLELCKAASSDSLRRILTADFKKM